MCNCKKKVIRNKMLQLTANQSFQTIESDKILFLRMQNTGVNTAQFYSNQLQGVTLLTSQTRDYPVVPGCCPYYYALQFDVFFSGAGTSNLNIEIFYEDEISTDENCPVCTA